MKKLLIILLILFFANNLVYALTDWYVDPDATGTPIDGTTPSKAYRSLAAFLTAEATDLVTATDIYHVHMSASSGTDDTSYALIDDGTWTTNSSYYLIIEGDSTGTWDDSKYVLHNNDSDLYILRNEENYVVFRNFQIKISESSTNGRNGIACLYQTASNHIVIDSLIVKGGTISGTGSASAFYLNDSDLVIDIYNCLIYDIISGEDGSFKGIYNDSSNTTDIYNCTFENCFNAIDQDAGTVNIINSIIANCTDGLTGTFNQYRYLCDDDNDDDGDGHNQSPAGGDWTTVFTDLAGEDYSIKNTGTAYDNGTDNPGTGLYSDDIIGLSRTSTWDIGAYEYDDSGGGSSIPIFMYHYNYH